MRVCPPPLQWIISCPCEPGQMLVFVMVLPAKAVGVTTRIPVAMFPLDILKELRFFLLGMLGS